MYETMVGEACAADVRLVLQGPIVLYHPKPVALV